MIDIALDIATHDLDLTNGSASLVEGRDHDRQDIDNAIQFFRGEWFLDPADGLPYFERILVKNVNEGDVLAIVRDYLLRRDSVQVVQDLDLEIDSSPGRTITIFGDVIDSTGEVTPIQSSLSF
jgi:hypothetical protein